MRHLRSDTDLDAASFARVLQLGRAIKRRPADYRDRLAGQSVAAIFAKPSTRTRVSFEVGIYQLGAQALVLATSGAGGLQVGRGETVADTAQVMSRYVHAIVIRTFAQAEVDELAARGAVPVINALTDSFHPCQALADAMTMQEHFGDLHGRKLVFVGPGNNVSHSLLLAGPRGGFDVVCACPPSAPPDPAIFARAQADAKEAGTRVSVEHDVVAAVAGAHVVYTDTWVSMGQEADRASLLARLRPYSVTQAVMEAAGKDAVFMHCLPAHRGEEVAAEVLDGPRSVIFDEAENRLHVQKALLLLLLEAEPWE
ncbi:MAG: ornithine carbamoyltransferase [Deltaproteobacteria bacterium]|nr:ornithine carbamoyltransferase [Deltaproteobacteria bacterium]